MEENQTPTVIEQPTELVTVAKESGIELSKAEAITMEYVPFLMNIREAEQASTKINFESPTKIDELIAREIRLKLVPNRTAADKFKKEKKELTTLINGLHDGAYKVVENTSKLLELKLANEKKEAQDKIRSKRNEELKPYIIFIRDYNTLLNASDSEYEKQLKEIQQAAIDQSAYYAKAQQERFDKELKEQQELAEQKDKADKLAAELKAKEDLAKQIESDKIAAKKKALKAPDKEKIKQIAMHLEVILGSLPTVKSEEANAAISQIKILIQKTITYTKEKAEQI